ncbi:MAG: hypothetical protein II792_07850 [Prevotella sp.]|nr:hypothetical protein [Prevotella sp.]
MSKSFTEYFFTPTKHSVAENGRFATVGKPRQMKKGAQEACFCTNTCFCAAFLPSFRRLSHCCKHAAEEKVNAKFFCGVDF